jgi:hypothetical protein
MLNVVEDHGPGVVQRSRLDAGIARDVDDGERKSGLHAMDPRVGRSARTGQQYGKADGDRILPWFRIHVSMTRATDVGH